MALLLIYLLDVIFCCTLDSNSFIFDLQFKNFDKIRTALYSFISWFLESDLIKFISEKSNSHK